MLDDDKEPDQEISFVEEHGLSVLNWGFCIGKASEFRVLKYIDEGIYGKVYLAQYLPIYLGAIATESSTPSNPSTDRTSTETP